MGEARLAPTIAGRTSAILWDLGGSRPSAAEILAELGYQVAGQSRPPANDPDIPSRTAWIIAR
jgi:hypothetical protein